MEKLQDRVVLLTGGSRGLGHLTKKILGAGLNIQQKLLGDNEGVEAINKMRAIVTSYQLRVSN